jgi:hypothetical protein
VSAAVQQRLSPAACEAFQQSVAAAVDNNLRRYRQRLQQAQQQLLQRELGSAGPGPDNSSSSDPAQQQQECTAATLNADCNDLANAASCVADGSGVKQREGGGAGVDTTVLTMQQLVALLAKRDAQPEEQQEGQPMNK